jgi:hypothetical protein
VKVSDENEGGFTESHGSTGSMKCLGRTRQRKDPATAFFQGSLLVSLCSSAQELPAPTEHSILGEFLYITGYRTTLTYETANRAQM